jgi:outer membrane receptor protein involved in Fe transport
VSGTERGGVNYDSSAVANLVLSSGVAAVRVGIDYGRDSGWINHYSLDDDLLARGVNDQWHGVIKLSALVKPADNLSITPSLWLQRVNSSDSPVFYPDVGLYDQEKYVAEPSNDRLIIPALDIVANLPFADLTSVSSYFDREEIRTTDGTYFNDYSFAHNYLDVYLPGANTGADDSIIANIPSPVAWNTRYKQFTQEVRLSSRADSAHPSPLKWTGGLYVSHQRIDHLNSEYSPGLNAAFQSIYGFPLSDPVVQNALGSSANTFANDLIFRQANVEDITEYSAFGQLDYDIFPTLHGSVGMRYETATASNSVTTSGYYGIGIPTPFYATGRFNSPTPKFSLVYDLNDESTVYTTVGKGYRLGAGNTPDPAGPGNLCSRDYASLGLAGAPNTYKSDSLWSYELGTKLTLAQRTLAIRAATYLIDWKNIQQTFVLPTCGFNLTGNFGDARSYGGELEMDFKPPFARNLTLGLTSGATHSTITRTADPGIVQVGEHVLYVPEWTATLHADYHTPIGRAWSAFIRTDYAWTGQSNGSYQQTNPNYIDPSYAALNASLGLETDSLEISLYGKNLTDDRTIIQRPLVNNLVEGYAVRPLTIGVSLAKHF